MNSLIILFAACALLTACSGPANMAPEPAPCDLDAGSYCCDELACPACPSDTAPACAVVESPTRQTEMRCACKGGDQ